MVERRKTCKKYFSVFFFENPNPDPIFFVYVKLLISLLNGALFRLGENFSVRGYGARFFAEQNFASDEKFAKSIFWSGATGQDFWRAKIAQAMKKYFLVFFLRKPEPRSYIFCLSQTAHFLIKRCIFAARGQFFGPGLWGEILGRGLSPII